MRRKSTHHAEAADVNVTPLLDIVFIMLIFFIVTATFLKEKGIDVRTPEDTPPEEETIPPPALLLSVQEDGFVRVNNVRIIDPYSVKPVVEEFMAREPRGVVLVSAAPDSKAGIAVTVMDQARQGNASAVSLALQQER
ncbi:ExbD/TolR family protein [Amphiplicatus metriothermophilus]|uniref:Biopolymer transport protein ExbD n=1 Tax=Amphiplicatus metriothermophilus TaxID=1519374 RepID=A0A239PI95_9PROT|nr:biopolymer transporter ExbD [Amphiplicatus metriothermophilus]MBB5518135.1 biopolymer transport protein ExbD [Amphiplicatus metriothermophilus]SNT67531.1 biopolymer transport protein ExbD [Amphiplicatus metriothermophilus]